MRRTNDEELTRDTIQDLFVKLWTNRKNLRMTEQVKYYLLTAFKNSLLNALTRRGHRKDQPAADPDNFLLHFSEPFHLTETERAQKSAQLLDALNQLSPRQKEIIYLRYFEELEYDQIATLLDISAGATYKLHYRALEALKEILALSRGDLLILLLAIRIRIIN